MQIRKELGRVRQMCGENGEGIWRRGGWATKNDNEGRERVAIMPSARVWIQPTSRKICMGLLAQKIRG